jgi:hypothetical protein
MVLIITPQRRYIFLAFYAIYAVTWIYRHSSAHLRQVSAQWRQCSLSCFEHSSAQASQIVAHSVARCASKVVPNDSADAVSQQLLAQSRHKRAHCGRLPSSMQCAAQLSHSAAHELIAMIAALFCI